MTKPSAFRVQTLTIADGNTVDLSSIDTDTDDQTLSLSGTDLTIEDGNTVDLSSIDTDTDDQTLSLSGTDLTIDDGNTVDLSSIVPTVVSVFDTLGGVVLPGSAVDETSDDFVFGSDQLDDDGNSDHDARFFFDKSLSAFRAGESSGTEWDESNIGQYSFASGFATKANDDYTTAMGFNTKASKNYATALGASTVASGNAATSMGFDTQASGVYSLATGYESKGKWRYFLCRWRANDCKRWYFYGLWLLLNRQWNGLNRHRVVHNR